LGGGGVAGATAQPEGDTDPVDDDRGERVVAEQVAVSVGGQSAAVDGEHGVGGIGPDDQGDVDNGGHVVV
jgi:hypothetical protein